MSPKLLNILLVLIPVILYYGVFEPLSSGQPGPIWTPGSSLGALQMANVQYTNTIKLISGVEKDMKKINNDYLSIPAASTTQVLTMLPDEIDPLRLRNEVNYIADKEGVAVPLVKVTEDGRISTPGTGAYLVTIGFHGKYKDLKRLLMAFEKSTRFYNIDSMIINRSDPKGLTAQELLLFDKDALQVQIAYKVYYLLSK